MPEPPAGGPPPPTPPGFPDPEDWEPPDLARLELIEPTDAELWGCWPDESAGPPDDGDAWLAELSAAEMEAIYGDGADGMPATGVPADHKQAPGSGFCAGGALDEMLPGPVLAAFSQDVLETGLAPLSDDELVGVLRAARRLSSWQAAVEFSVIGELDARRKRESGRPGWSRVSEHISSELAAALTLTGRSADTLLCVSRDLARLPAVLRALAAGRIDRPRAEVFAMELAALTDIQAAAVASAFWDIAGSMTTGQLRAALRAMVLSLDPAALRRRVERARADSRVETWREGSGNAAVAGRELSSADAIVADRRIAATARALKEAGAPGTMDQLRAAVFVALLTGRNPETLVPARDNRPGPSGTGPCDADLSGTGLSGTGPSGNGPSGSGLAGSVNLTMPLSAWLGYSQAPGEVAGLGPLDAQTCRELAGRIRIGPTARWCLTLTGSDGRALAHACCRAGPGPPDRHRAWLNGLKLDWLESGTCSHAHRVRGYRPSNKLRTLVKVRHRTCCFPGCRRPARVCDDDHTTPYDQGGLTCECNLSPLCRRHHQAKQAPGWSLTQPEPGLMVWVTPHGRSYTVAPDPYPA